MTIIEIHDEQLAHQIQQIADQENRPVEEVLRSLISQYKVAKPAEQDQPSAPLTVGEVRKKLYAKARHYWQSVDDHTKAIMTDEALVEEFGGFDENGIPRLKSELPSPEPPVGSLAYAAKIIRETGGVQTDGSLDVTKADDILSDEFADELIKRISDSNAPK